MSRLHLALMILLATAAATYAGQQRVGSIAGTLLGRDGRPAANVRVSAISPGGVSDGEQTLISIAQTDANGRFVLESVPAGRYYVGSGRLSAPSYYPGVASRTSAQMVTVASGQAVTGVDFRVVVPSSVRVSGRIIREDGLPLSPLEPGLPSASVTLRPKHGNGGAYHENTDDDGRFVFRGIPPGPYEVGASAALAWIPQDEMTIMDDIANLELFVPFFVPAVARVTVEGGGPVPRFQLRFSRITGSRFEVRIVNTPLFEEKLRPGDYRVTFTDLLTSYRLTALTANGRDLLTHPYTVTPAGAPEIEARLAAAASPPPWRKVSGKFAGRALADRTSVKVWNELSAGPLDMTFYLDGSFEMLALPGKTRVVAMNPDLGEFVTTEFTVPPSDLDHVTIDLPAALRSPSRVTGHIEGRARAASGARELVLRAEGSAETKELRTPLYMDGTFEFSSIQPGAYLAEIDGGKPVKVIVSPGADDIVVRVDGNQ